MSILSKEGYSIQPQAFKINEITLTNYLGEEIIINNMVSEVKIRESIYLPSLILEISLGDAINFFEMYGLSGQEQIKIDFQKISIHNTEIVQKIQLNFYVAEYSAYVKSPNNASIQAYTIKGISPFAYNSKFQKISRAYTNNSTAEIAKILKNDLYEDNFVINGLDATTHTGIINIQEPLSAIEYLRKTAFDDKGAPFYVYQKLNGTIHVDSLTHLNDENSNPVQSKLLFLKGYKSVPNSPEDYKERAQRILDTKSNLEMSKIFQANEGAFASNNYTLDIKTKQYSNKQYNYDSENNAVLRNNCLSGDRYVYSQAFKIGRDNKNSINVLPEAHQEFIATNSGAFGSSNTYNGDMSENIEKLNSYTALQDSISQTINICGSFVINAGSKVNLVYPRAIEAEGYKSINPDAFDTVNKDEIMSGNYLVVSAIHTFSFTTEGSAEHFTSLDVRKDSIF
jgi:hypothetical protein